MRRGSDKWTAGRPCDGNDRRGMAAIGVDFPLICSIPDLYRRVSTAIGNQVTLLRPADRFDTGGFANRDHVSGSQCIPHLQSFVIAARSDSSTIRRPCQCVHLVTMAAIDA